MSEALTHIVVLFGVEDEPDWCSVKPCPTHAHGPFTASAAEAFAKAAPDWMNPHVPGLAPNDDACAG